VEEVMKIVGSYGQIESCQQRKCEDMIRVISDKEEEEEEEEEEGIATRIQERRSQPDENSSVHVSTTQTLPKSTVSPSKSPISLTTSRIVRLSSQPRVRMKSLENTQDREMEARGGGVDAANAMGEMQVSAIIRDVWMTR